MKVKKLVLNSEKSRLAGEKEEQFIPLNAFNEWGKNAKGGESFRGYQHYQGNCKLRAVMAVKVINIALFTLTMSEVLPLSHPQA